MPQSVIKASISIRNSKAQRLASLLQTHQPDSTLEHMVRYLGCGFSSLLYQLESDSPGPGAYTASMINEQGSTFLSKYKSIKSGRFSSSLSRAKVHEKQSRKGYIHASHYRLHYHPIETPGPGSYLMPSDFGVYISTKSLNSTMQNFGNNNSFSTKPQTPASYGSRPKSNDCQRNNLRRILNVKPGTPVASDTDSRTKQNIIKSQSVAIVKTKDLYNDANTVGTPN